MERRDLWLLAYAAAGLAVIATEEPRAESHAAQLERIDLLCLRNPRGGALARFLFDRAENWMAQHSEEVQR